MDLVYKNSFEVLIEIETLEEDVNKTDSSQAHIKIDMKEEIIRNMVKELEIKEELYNIEIITIQALDAILEKLVLNQVKEQQI